MVKRSERMWSTGEGNGKPIQYSCLENPVNSMKRQKDRTLKDELPRLISRDMGSIPGQRTKIPHAEEQLSPRAITRNPT